MTAALADALADVADTDVPTLEFVAKVVRKVAEDAFVLQDLSGTANLKFHARTDRNIAKIDIGSVYRFFSLKKMSADGFLFDQSYLMEEKDHQLGTIKILEVEKCITTKDFGKYTNKQFIQDPIFLKCIKIFDPAYTRAKNIKFQKVLLADEHGSMFITFWREDTEKIQELFDSSFNTDVYKIKNFAVDAWSKDQGEVKKNLLFVEGRTQIVPVTDAQYQLRFQAVDPNNKVIKGQVRFIEKFYSYLSCHLCGKKWTPGNSFCEKVSCNTELDENSAVDDYVVTLIAFENSTHNAITISAWRKSLQEHETTGDSPKEKLRNITGRNASITIQPSTNKGDNDVLKKLTFEN